MFEHDIAVPLSLPPLDKTLLNPLNRLDGKASKWRVSYGVFFVEMSGILLRARKALSSWRHFVSPAFQAVHLARDVRDLKGGAALSFESADLLQRARQNRHNKGYPSLILSLNES